MSGNNLNICFYKRDPCGLDLRSSKPQFDSGCVLTKTTKLVKNESSVINSSKENNLVYRQTDERTDRPTNRPTLAKHNTPTCSKVGIKSGNIETFHYFVSLYAICHT